jgi:hypothetical protein
MLFIALVLQWPMIFVYVIGALPLFIAAQIGSAKGDRTAD